jgi:Methyltransferase FkbM domain
MEQVQFKFPNRAAPKGGIVGPRFRNQQPSEFGEDQPRFTVTLSEILERFQAPSVIDYLSLDVEGAEEYILQGFPFDKYTILVLTIENPNLMLCDLLESKGYIMVKKLKKQETLWIHQSIKNEIDNAALEIDSEQYKYSERDQAES